MASSRRTGTNENISTYGDGTRNYTALATWESATDNDLVTATTSEVLECYADSATFTDSISVVGATTSALYHRIIRPATGEGHDGTTATGVHFTTTGTGDVVRADEGNFKIYDIIVSSTTNSASGIVGIHFAGAADSVAVGCIANITNAGAGLGTGFQASSVAAKFINCISLNCKNTGFFNNTGGTVLFYNCSAVGGERGILLNLGTSIVKNCLGHNTSIQDLTSSGTTTGSTNNASEDTSAFGTVNYQSQSFTFSTATDLKLHRNDLGAMFRGADLSADANFDFNDDIIGTTVTSWSIGAHSPQTTRSARRTGDNENISTFGGVGRDYTAISTWEAATDNDLVTGAVTEVLECYADSASFSDTLAAAGATTNGRFFRIIRPAAGQGHPGNPSSGVIFSGTGTNNFDIAENFFSLQDVVVISAGNSAGSVSAVRVTASVQVTVVGCIAKATNAGAGTGISFTVNNASSPTLLALCVGYESDGYGFFLDGAGIKRVISCDAVNNGITGFHRNNGTVTTRTCLSDGNLTADFAGTMTDSDYNASTDATASGANSRLNQTFTYKNDAGNDYHLTVNDAGAKGFGISAATSIYYNFNDDIDSNEVTTWSIGFDSDPIHVKRLVDSLRLNSKVHGVLA